MLFRLNSDFASVTFLSVLESGLLPDLLLRLVQSPQSSEGVQIFDTRFSWYFKFLQLEATHVKTSFDESWVSSLHQICSTAGFIRRNVYHDVDSQDRNVESCHLWESFA